MRTSIMNVTAAITGKYFAAKSALVLLAALAGVQGCATLTEAEREQLAYNFNEARSIYEERRQACLDSGAYMVTKTLTGSRRLTIAEMEWAYCTR